MSGHGNREKAFVIACLLLAAGLATAASPESAHEPRVRLGPLADRPRGGGKAVLHLTSPTVRIGLTGDGRTLSVESSGGLYVVDRETGRDVWKHIHRGILRVVLERGGVAAPAPVFRVQVASLASEQEASALKERLEEETNEVVQVTRNPDRNAWRVRVGQRASREEIRQVEEKVRALGFDEIWVAQEAGSGGREPRLRLVDDDYNDMVSSSKGLLVLPAAEGRPVKVADVPYRGVIEVLLTRGREVQAVNLLNIEDYLKGVVPKELGPSVYPELEALKAQAVAARTYVEANRGQFSEDGFDICDTARCQVYGGMAGEHPMSDLAVEQTSGIIATYEGVPINALYTSTCGGHTEDLTNVFREMKGPYLKGVACYPDEAELAASRRGLKGSFNGQPVILPGGERLDEAIALLEVLGVLSAAETDPEAMALFSTGAEAGRWTSRTLSAAGREKPAGVDLTREIPDTPALADYLISAFGWRERVEMLVDPRDLTVFLDPATLDATPPPARPGLAYLIKEGILPRAGGSQPVSRALLARALYRMLLRYEATGLRSAKYRGSRGGDLGLHSEGTLSFHPPAQRLHIMIRDGSATLEVGDYLLHDGDSLEYHLSGKDEVDYIVVKANGRSASDDRYSNVYLWEARMPRDELESRIRARASIGRLVDLIPGGRGVSGRLLDLTVVGTSGRFTFYGFNIERLLGLKETLFLVDRQHAPDGSVETFIFTGKGWGHGVGLCQVGAYGMALRGKTYEEILHHYYTGVTLQKIAQR